MTTESSRPVFAPLSLAMAVVESSNAPLLLLDANLTVLGASASFCRVFGIDPDQVADRPIGTLGQGEWDNARLASLLRATASGFARVDAYEMDLNRPDLPPRRLVLNAQKLDYSDADNVRLLLAVSDVTDARLAEKLKDELLREKAILLQEVQHRVANSLQIIASILLLKARAVTSDETRHHLQDAHRRVMSVAAVQQHLHASEGIDEIEVRGYLTTLCESLGASMIGEGRPIAIVTTADRGMIDSARAVSIGLIVTELLINAVKYAFPEPRDDATIRVVYEISGPDWKLTVADNGVGKSSDDAKPVSGLGTAIVRALVKQLDAHMETGNSSSGMSISIARATFQPRTAKAA